MFLLLPLLNIVLINSILPKVKIIHTYNGKFRIMGLNTSTFLDVKLAFHPKQKTSFQINIIYDCVLI